MNDQRRGGIAWTDFTWPVVNGCRRVSAGCGGPNNAGGCYAERLAATRLAHTPKYAGLATMTPSGPRWTGETRLWEPSLVEPIKLRSPAKIFVADMGDLFYEGVSDEDVDRVFAVMALAGWHSFQILTKRVARMRAYLATQSRADRVRHAASEFANGLPRNLLGQVLDLRDGLAWPLPNVWAGCSVEDQKSAEDRLDDLCHSAAAVLWVSFEPAIGPVEFDPWLEEIGHETGGPQGWVTTGSPISWLVCGGESGPNARPFDFAWAQQAREACRRADVPWFWKQAGANFRIDGHPLHIAHSKGGDLGELRGRIANVDHYVFDREWPKVPPLR